VPGRIREGGDFLFIHGIIMIWGIWETGRGKQQQSLAEHGHIQLSRDLPVSAAKRELHVTRQKGQSTGIGRTGSRAQVRQQHGEV
jgi:hypothetical protein